MDANWQDIDTGTLSAEAKAAYDAYKVAQRQAAALRETFETTLTASLPIPQGMRMVFGYRFGKLSAAIVEDERKPKTTKRAGSLADFIAAQAASGRAC